VGGYDGLRVVAGQGGAIYLRAMVVVGVVALVVCYLSHNTVCRFFTSREHTRQVLGKGSFGKVVLVEKANGGDKGSGHRFAMKVLKKSKLRRAKQVRRHLRSTLCVAVSPPAVS